MPCAVGGSPMMTSSLPSSSKQAEQSKRSDGPSSSSTSSSSTSSPMNVSACHRVFSINSILRSILSFSNAWYTQHSPSQVCKQWYDKFLSMCNITSSSKVELIINYKWLTLRKYAEIRYPLNSILELYCIT